jgi:unsaturated rhamnogalacturonyl hydrolase
LSSLAKVRLGCLLLLLTTAHAAETRYAGLTASAKRIEVFFVRGKPASGTIMLAAGFTGEDETSKMALEVVRQFDALPEAQRPFNVLVIPVVNPEKSKLQFPPQGIAYRENPESHALWRWTAIHAPDSVFAIAEDDFGFTRALSSNTAGSIGRIPAQRLSLKNGDQFSFPELLPPSAAHAELDRRRARTPRQLADELAKIYGHDFDQVTYIPGMALISQLRLGNRAEVEKLAAPYVSGSKDSLGTRPSSLTLAGHLLFGDLAERTKAPEYTVLVRKAADLGFTETGAMKESMPFHDEMSDSVFMGTSILARAGKLTGDRKYFDMADRHLQFMDKLVLRPDHLYRHSPLDDAAWGRGNAFPALGLSLTLSDYPKDHPAYSRVLASYRTLMATLVRFQDSDGMWHEVIDEPGSYAETSATSMIGFAIERGIRRGWLDGRDFQSSVDRAWRAVSARVASDGMLFDICESTNKQRTLRDYLNRAAILDRDPRGGGMAMLFATEMAGLE